MEEIERILAKNSVDKIGEKVKVAGWVSNIRDHGQLIFIDLRDWSGKVQLVIDVANQNAIEVAKNISLEFVVSAVGEVAQRDSNLVNDKLETGSIEIKVDTLELVSKSLPIPFPLDTEGHEIDENVRFKYRYIDLRRERLRNIMHKKHMFIHSVRNHLTDEGFTEVITPLLTSTSPEGARDFLIPSRVHQGKFYVLPQAPQQFKQMLMVGGVDKYFQIAPCARDEDPRADRHAGIFYQIDIEMSFPTIDRLFGACEKLIQSTYSSVAPHKKIAKFPFPRLPYDDAMNRFGSDKPDLRFGMELQDITEAVKGKTDFNVFNNADVIKCVVAEGCGEWSRTEIAEMEEFAKTKGAKGLAYTKVTNGTLDTGVSKFLTSVASEIIKQTGAKDGDLIFFCADQLEVVNKVLGAVRSKLGDMLNLKDPNELNFVWITDFPFYEYDEKAGKLDFAHNPFSMPQGGMEAFDVDDPMKIKTNQYDLALNGYEILSGSIRNHNPEVMVKAFETIGYGREEILKKFGGLYNAFQYGAPPHGGWAIGFDRMFMVMIDEDNIRDVYAFPLNSSGVDLLMNAPSEVSDEDMAIAGIEQRNHGSKVDRKIRTILDELNVEYKHVEHDPVKTSEESARVRGTKLNQGAKTLVLKSKEYDQKFIMVVIPADQQGDLAKISAQLGEEVQLATGDEIFDFAGIEIGGVPPFGRLLGMELYFDKAFWEKKEIAFNTGRRDRSIVMQASDLIKAAQPDKKSADYEFTA